MLGAKRRPGHRSDSATGGQPIDPEKPDVGDLLTSARHWAVLQLCIQFVFRRTVDPKLLVGDDQETAIRSAEQTVHSRRKCQFSAALRRQLPCLRIYVEFPATGRALSRTRE